jgi:hypothetical protein
MGGTIASRRARLAIGVIVVALVIGDGLALRSVLNRARPVPITQVLARYRSHTQPSSAAPETTVAPVAAASTAPTAAPTTATRVAHSAPPVAPAAGETALSAPAPGVYVYATSGHEDTDAAGGVHHAYPDQTTITVTPQGCGFTMRWDALQQRWDEWTACVAGRQLQVQVERMKHAFYGINDERAYSCTDARLRPGAEAAGTPVGGRCDGSNDVGYWSGQVVGHESVMIGGVAVPAIHVVVNEHMTGGTVGDRHSDNWFAENSALLLKRVSMVTGESETSVGKVHYREQVSMVLLSLTPQQ